MNNQKIRYHRTVAYCLLTLMSFQYLLFYPIAMLGKELAKEEMFSKLKHEIPLHLLCKIKNSKTLIWENANEFEYNGEMYDVVKSSITSSGETVYYCVNDEKESDIVKHIENHRKKNEEEKKSMQKSNVIFSIDFNTVKTKCMLIIEEKLKQKFSYANYYKFDLYSFISQPPQQV